MSTVYLDAVLEPPRSLSLRGFNRVMIFFGGTSFVMGAGFLLAGAWPVAGFMGLEVRWRGCLCRSRRMLLCCAAWTGGAACGTRASLRISRGSSMIGRRMGRMRCGWPHRRERMRWASI
ncbi:MAG: hypothetical protein B7Z38_05345 [Rhodobacterales bacterium 12-64-8]|nr:MAG: hypothetical protein B7Z38_05345 [Rhodobacterales bacterium 12-64-8]